MANNERKNVCGEEIVIELSDRIGIIVNEDHSKLDNLDYESSGHTGFASSGDIEQVNERLTLLDNNKVPKRLNLIPNLEANADRKNAFLYVDNNGNESKVSISDMLGYIIRRGGSIPSDMQPNEYLFLEIKEEN